MTLPSADMPCTPGRVHSSLSGNLGLELREISQVGAARRAVTLIGQRVGLGATAVGTAALVATEVAKNLVLHGGGGELLLWWTPEGPDGPVIELLAVDRGPGMSDPDACFRDGFSTAGTPGTGLGAVRRAARELALWTRPGEGTVLWLELGARRGAGRPDRRFETAALAVPHPGEEVSGDAWAIVDRGARLDVLMVDGLGHGPLAAAAARRAVAHFCAQPETRPDAMVEGLHDALSRTRGAAVAVARLDTARAVLSYCGVGNIAGRLLGADGSSAHLISHGGTAGQSLGRVQLFEHPLPPGALMVLHSDGVATRWNLDDRPGLAARHPGLVAGVLYRDYRRQRDDAGVLAVRHRRAVPPS